jgi:hypothetical protein
MRHQGYWLGHAELRASEPTLKLEVQPNPALKLG